MSEDQLFYVGQKAFIDKDGEVLVLRHSDGDLDFPGGKIQENQLDFVNELKREVREETGLEIDVGDPFVVWHMKYPKKGYNIYLVGFKCRFVSGELKLSTEHGGHEWVNRENYQALKVNDPYFDVLNKYFEN